MQPTRTTLFDTRVSSRADRPVDRAMDASETNCVFAIP